MNDGKEVILITGCSGRIGFKAAERFADKYQIVGFDVFLIGHLPDVEFFGVDMASDASVDAGLKQIKKKYGNRIAAVIHLAAYYNFTGGGWSHYENITIKGTERLLKGLKNFQVDQFIFSSTMLVHAPCMPGQKIDENWPIVPKWEYPKSKVMTEQLIRDQRGTMSSVILRIAGVYDDRCHSIPLSNQLQRIFENQFESHLFSGRLDHGASFVHMDDLIEALWSCVEKRKELPKETVFEIGEPVTLSYQELQNTMSQALFGKNWKTWSIPKPIAKVGAWLQDHLPFFKKSFIKPWMIDIADDHYELDITHARKVLGWNPRYSVKDTIPKWSKELKSDPISWYDENKLRAPSWLTLKK